MLKDENETISITYYLKNGSAQIGHRASFGFPEIQPGLSFQRLQAFMDEFYKHLHIEKVKFVQWLHFPELYNPEYNPVIIQTLLNLGFVIENSYLNHHLRTDQDFEKALRKDTKRRLNKINNSGVITELYEDIENISFYDKIAEWRKKKGLPLNIDKDILENLIGKLRDKYLLFTVKKDNQLIAACLGLKITKDTLYYFIPSHDPEFDELSPSIALIQKMHEYAVIKNIDYLDLGISSGKNEEENYGLIHFKEKLGGNAGIKYSLIKELR